MAERVAATTKKPEAKQKCSNICKQESGSNSSGCPAEILLKLQRTAGNQAVQKLIKSGALQRKQKIEAKNKSERLFEAICENTPSKVPPMDVNKKSMFSNLQSKEQGRTEVTARSEEPLREKVDKRKVLGAPAAEVKEDSVKPESPKRTLGQLKDISTGRENEKHNQTEKTPTDASKEQKQQDKQSVPKVTTPKGLPARESLSKEVTRTATQSAANTAKEERKTLTSPASEELSPAPPGESMQQTGGTAVGSPPSIDVSTPGEEGGSSEEQAEAEKTRNKMAEASKDEGTEGEEAEEIETPSSPEIDIKPPPAIGDTTSPQTRSAITPAAEEGVTGAAELSEESSVEKAMVSEEPAEREDTEASAEGKIETAPSATSISGGELDPSERNAAISSLAEGSKGEASLSSGVGSGTAIEEKPEVQTPDISSADPSQALTAISGLPPGKIVTALGGVSSAVSRVAGEQREELASNPPMVDRPSGAPATRKTELADSIPVSTGEKKQPVKRVPAGKTVPVPKPQPLPPAPAPPIESVPHPQIQGGSEGQMSSSDAAGLQASVSQLPTADPGLEVSAGAPPPLNLEGDADPARVQEQKEKLNQSISEAHIQGHHDLSQPMGESEIYPKVPQEVLRSQIKTHGAGSAAGGIAGSKSKGTAPSGGGDKEEAASIIAREQHGAEIQAAIATAQKDMAVKRQEHSKKVSQEQSKSKAEITKLESENSKTQAKEREKAQTDVQDLRSDWTKEQQEVVDQSNKESDTAKQQAHTDVAQEREQGETQAAKHVEEGNKEASEARDEAKREATELKKQGEKESSGVLGWLASKAQAFFDKIKSGIKAAFDKARAIVRSAIEKAKKLATEAIEKARQAIVNVIRKVGDVLIAIGDRVLANFPKLRDRFRKAIKDRVSKAEAAVNKLADKLKKDVQKSLDMLGAGLDAALGLMEKGMLAAVDAANKTVQGAIKAAQAVVNAIAAFASLIKDIAANPGQWIHNLGASIMDGIRNHLWKAFKVAVMGWFNQKLEEVLGLGTAIWNLLKKGGIAIAEIGKMAWEALKSAIPIALIQILIEKLVSMIVPAAGAVMAIIEGLQAAWGTVSRVIQSFGLFFTFLKTVKKGNAGPQFAAALAAAAIVVIDFVANWLLKRLRKPAGKIAGKLKAMAQRIMEKVKKVAKKIAAKVKGAAAKIKAKFKKFTERFKKPKKTKEAKPKKSKSEKAQERLDKAVRALQPKIQVLLQNRVSRLRLAAQLLYWRIGYGLTRLEIKGQEDNVSVVATVNPTKEVVKNIVERHGILLLTMIREIGREILNDPSVKEHLERIIEQRATKRGGEPEQPIILEPGLGFPAQAADIAGVGRSLGIIRPGTTRAPWTREHMEFGETPIKEWQTYSSGAGHIRVGEVGTYDQILAQWEGIRGATVSTDAEMATAMRLFRQTGSLDPKFRAHQTKFAALNRLLFGVEMGRSHAQVVTGTALMDLMENRQITASQGLKALHPMSMVGAVRTAAAVDVSLGEKPAMEYKTKASPERIKQMMETELEVMTHILYAKMQIEKPLFNTVAQLEIFIKKHLKDYLKNEIMSGFTLNEG